MSKEAAIKFVTDDQKWEAVLRNTAAADAVFWYGVKTTHIVCIPSCPSRNPHRHNVQFLNDLSVAINQGFRPCKRCKPQLKGHVSVLDASPVSG